MLQEKIFKVLSLALFSQTGPLRNCFIACPPPFASGIGSLNGPHNGRTCHQFFPLRKDASGDVR